MTFCKPHNRNSLLFANNLPQKHVFSLQIVSSCNNVYEHTHSAADKKITAKPLLVSRSNHSKRLSASTFTPCLNAVKGFIGLLMAVEGGKADVALTAGTEAHTWSTNHIGSI